MFKDPLMTKIYNNSINKDDYCGNTYLYEFTLCLSILCLFLANVFAQKIIPIYGDIKIAMSGIFFGLSFLPLSVLNEVYGYKKSARAIISILICQFLFISLLCVSSRIDNSSILLGGQLSESKALFVAFGDYYKVLMGSCLAVAISYFFFSILNSWLKVRFCSYPFPVRFILSTGISKFLLVAIAYPINLYGMYSTFWEIFLICLSTWVVKIIIALLVLFLASIIIPIVKKVEKRSHYDINVNFNPLKVYRDDHSGHNLFNGEIREKENVI